MSIKEKKRGRGVWLMPVLLAIPFLAVMAWLTIRFGPDLLRILSAAVKTVVVV